MSILNFMQFDDDTAVVVVDTLNSLGRECSKMLPIPHLGAVIAGRGRADVFVTLALRTMVCSTFDAAADELERDFSELLDAAPLRDESFARSLGIDVEALRAQTFGAVTYDEIHSGQQVLLVGLSERSGHLDAVYLRRGRPGTPVEVIRHAELVVGPSTDELIQTASLMLSTDTGAYLFASRQFAQCPETQRPGYGGRLLVARLSRGETTVRDLGALERLGGAEDSKSGVEDGHSDLLLQPKEQLTC